MIKATRRQVLGAAAALALTPLAGGCALGTRQGPLVGMEYETWFTCAMGGAPSVAAVLREAGNKRAALNAQGAAGADLGAPHLALSLAAASQVANDVDGRCPVRPAAGWAGREATPVLGTYESSDPTVIRQHAEWISGAGVDFLLIDWSNNFGGNWSNGVALGIMAATYNLVLQYRKLRQRPRFALLLGLDDHQAGTADFQQLVDTIWTLFLEPADLRPLYQEYLGKPLLGVFTGPRFTGPPTWSDPRFTVRWVNGFNETTHGNRMGYWSWIDRRPQITYRQQTGSQGLRPVAEAVTVAAGFPGGGPSSQHGWGSEGARRHGQTYLDQWAVAFSARPEVVLLCQWNEFNQPDQYSVELSNDMEPTQASGWGAHGQGGWGTYYLDLTRKMVEAFKAGRPQPKVTLDPSMP